MTGGSSAAELIAKRFHDTYERLAPSYGYATRRASAVSWDAVPEANRSLMIATVAELIGPGGVLDVRFPGGVTPSGRAPAEDHPAPE